MKNQRKITGKFSIVMIGALTIIMIIILLWGGEQNASKSQNASGKQDDSLRLILATDIHYLSPALIEKGELFDRMMSIGDGKQMNYIGEITDAFLDTVITEHPDGLILSGDLTFNGEKKSHEDLAKKLKKVKKAGIPVYVIPGNHDIQNFYASKYKKTSLEPAESVSATEFDQIYSSYGREDAMVKDEDSLSYIAEVSKDLWLFMLDTAKYEDNSLAHPSEASGRVRDTTYRWMETYLEKAKEGGITPIIVMHHNLLQHSILFDGYTVDNNVRFINLFQKYNAQLVLSGHMHIQAIDSKTTNGQTVYDIATSSLAVYTNQFGVVKFVPGEGLYYETQPVDIDAWAIKTKQKDKNLLEFEKYSHDFFSTNAYNKVVNRLEEGVSPEEAKLMAETFAWVNPYYFSGTANTIRQEVMKSEGYHLWVEKEGLRSREYVMSMVDGVKEDDTKLFIPFNE